MSCPQCRHVNRAWAKFCEQCGARLSDGLQVPSPPVVDHPLGAPLEGERKQVSVLFADMKGSMELVADRDPEEAQEVLDPLLGHMIDAVERYGGTVTQVMGDGVMTLFGAPLAHEDHAVRACYAALSMQEQVRSYGEHMQRTRGVAVQIRVGVSSGEAVLRVIGGTQHPTYVAVGQTVHLAARMEQIARPGSILVTGDTLRLVESYVHARSLGSVKVKGLDALVEVSEITGARAIRSRFDAAAARGLTPFVGRAAELARLHEAFAEVAGGDGRVVAVVGEAGAGKSRLVREFLGAPALAHALVLEGGSAPAGGGGLYRPGMQILRSYFDVGAADDVEAIREKVAGRIVSLDGSDEIIVPVVSMLRALPPSSPFHRLDVDEQRQRWFDALVWLVRRVSAQQPLVLVYEDVQAVTSDNRQFLEALARRLPPATMVLLTYRSEYDDAWLAGPDVRKIVLTPLTAEAVAAMLHAWLAPDPARAGLARDLYARTGGNPLFVEECVRNLVETGQLYGEPGAYRLRGEGQTIVVPATVQAVLSARIDRLPADDKRVLQAVAAVGEAAPRAILDQVLELPAAELERALSRLQRADLLVADEGRGTVEYAIRHALVHDVVYESLLHERRRQLHGRIMKAYEASDDVDQLARHALRGELWERAAVHARAAGRRALAHFGHREAAAYFEQSLTALEHLPDAQMMAVDVRCDLRNALVPGGEHGRIRGLMGEALDIASAAGDRPRMARVLCFLGNALGNIGETEAALGAGEASLGIAEELGDVDLAIVGNLSVGEIHRTLGNYRTAAGFLRRNLALIDARRESDHLGQAGLPSVRTRSHLAWSLAELGEFPEALAVAREGLRIAEASAHAYTVSHAYLGLGGTLLRHGRFRETIPVLERGVEASRDVPSLFPPIAADLGVAYARTGQIEEGLRYLKEAVELATAMGRMSRLPLMLAKLGAIHLAAGDAPSAAEMAAEALRLAVAQKERGNEVYALRLFGDIHAGGNVEEAEAHYRRALALAEVLGMRPLVAHCHFGLAMLYAAGDKTMDARAHGATAVAMYREMEMRFWLEKTERMPGLIEASRS
ncbi:MAG TPA: adenylate/guanylate cyclase domain-containing protein [Methylomirabilota bacterium]